MEDADCDVLGIFDTCFASNLHQKGYTGHRRTYQLLAASGHDKTTVGPGPRSFTTALICSLKFLLEKHGKEPFTTYELCENINFQPTRRNNQSHVWSRLKQYDRFITLAPLNRAAARREEHHNYLKTRAHMSIRLSLTEPRLTEEQISTMAREFSKAVRVARAPVKSLHLVGLEGCVSFADAGRVLIGATQWRKKMFTTRHQQSSITMGDAAIQTQHDRLLPTTDDPYPPSRIPVADPSTRPHALGSSRKRMRSYEHNVSDSQLYLGTEDFALSHELRSDPLTPTSGVELDTPWLC